MASMPWIKFYVEFLDDPKIGRLGDRQKLRFVQLLLLAGECDMDGMLVNGDTALTSKDIAWRIRSDQREVFDDIAALVDVGLVAMDDEAITIVNFSKRQGRSQAERRAQWRESKQRRKSFQEDSKRNPVGFQALEESRVEKRREEEELQAQRPNNAPVIVTPQAASHVSMTPPPSNPEPATPKRSKPARKQSENYQPIFGWLQEFCQVNAPARIGRAAKSIDDSGAILGACAHFARWWKACDWRGQKGQAPTPEQVWQEWPKALAWDGSQPATRNGNGNGHQANEPAGFAAIREAMQDPRYIAEEEKKRGKLS